MGGDHDPTVERRGERRLRAGAGFLFAAAVLVVFRLQAFDLPLETDEANYAYIADRLVQGDRLYLEVWDHQPFGIYAFLAGVVGLFGDRPEVFRCTATAASLVGLACLMAILRKVSSERAALMGGILFALVSIDPGTGGEGCNREIYMNALILAAWCFALGERRTRGALLAAGLCLTAASTLKTVVAVHWLLLALWTACLGGSGRGSRNRAAASPLGDVALLAAGPIGVWVLAFGYFAATSRLAEFVDAVFLFNLGYAESGEPFWMRFARFFAPLRHRFIFESALPLWVLAGASALGVMVTARRRDAGPWFVVMTVLSGYLGVCLPGRFWPHYYHLLIPPCIIAVSYAAEALAGALSAPLGTARGGKVVLGWAVALTAPLLAGVWETRHFLLQSDFDKTVKRYNSRDFWGQAQGQNAASVTDPGDAIFVYGNDASIYYYAQRRCASRYTMITGLSEGMRGAQRRREILMEELRRSPPRLILVLFDQEPFDEWKAFLREQYGEPVGWDFNDERPDEAIMFVMARKDRPIERINWNWDRSLVKSRPAAPRSQESPK